MSMESEEHVPAGSTLLPNNSNPAKSDQSFEQLSQKRKSHLSLASLKNVLNAIYLIPDLCSHVQSAKRLCTIYALVYLLMHSICMRHIQE